LGSLYSVTVIINLFVFPVIGYRLSVTDNVSTNIKRNNNIIYFNQLLVFINIEYRLPLPMQYKNIMFNLFYHDKRYTTKLSADDV